MGSCGDARGTINGKHLLTLFSFVAIFLLAQAAEAQIACGGHGTPTSSGCVCNTGFSGPTCEACAPGYYNYPSCQFCNAETTCSGNGSCNSAGFCSCEIGFGGTSCAICSANYYGYPTCHFCSASITCNGHGACTSTGSCACQPGFTGPGCDVSVGPAITCLNQPVAVPDTATTCTACPAPSQIYSVQDPTAKCTVQPACPYAPGTTSVAVSCTSATGTTSAVCPLQVTESTPQLQCPDVTVACTGVLPSAPQGASVCSTAATSCALNTGSAWVAGAPLNGAVSYSCQASTPGGTTSCTGQLRTTDVGPSVSLETGPFNLWPANHKMQTFELSDCVAGAVDACTGQPIDINTNGRIVRVTSDEPQDAEGDGDGQTCGDAQITTPTSVQLRRERSGSGNGRVYTIHFEVSNPRGGVTSGTCQVGVPHSADSAAPVAEAPRFCVGAGCPTAETCTSPR